MKQPEANPVVTVSPKNLQTGLRLAVVFEGCAPVLGLFQKGQVRADRVVRRLRGGAGQRDKDRDHTEDETAGRRGAGLDGKSHGRHSITVEPRCTRRKTRQPAGLTWDIAGATKGSWLPKSFPFSSGRSSAWVLARWC